jgi:hypothetical protein
MRFTDGFELEEIWRRKCTVWVPKFQPTPVIWESLELRLSIAVVDQLKIEARFGQRFISVIHHQGNCMQLRIQKAE